MKRRKKPQTIAELLKKNPSLKRKLEKKGMFCSTCPFSHYETLEQGAEAHGLDVKKIKKINSNKKKKK